MEVTFEENGWVHSTAQILNNSFCFGLKHCLDPQNIWGEIFLALKNLKMEKSTNMKVITWTIVMIFEK